MLWTVTKQSDQQYTWQKEKTTSVVATPRPGSYWGHNGDPGELRTQFRVHLAATEVVFLKANFTLLNYLEAWVSSSSPPVLSEAEMCPHLYFLFGVKMCPHLHFLSELEMCPHLRLSSHVWEVWCPAYFSIMSMFHFIKCNDSSEKLFRPKERNVYVFWAIQIKVRNQSGTGRFITFSGALLAKFHGLITRSFGSNFLLLINVT